MDNKSRYQDAQSDLIEFVSLLLPKLAAFDDSVKTVDPKKTVFRIYRDVRFSKNKDPYKTNLGAHIHGGDKTLSRAGYYLHVEPGACMLAGGAYLPPSPWIKAIRKEIHYNGDELRKILASASFKKHFGEMEGETLKTSPRDYDSDHPMIDLLRHKSFLAVHPLKNADLYKSDFSTHSLKVFKALYPFDRFLNQSLD